MLRRLYRCAVRLHPSSFRRRFGEEMLYIFDQQTGELATLAVTLDCVLSLLRQWTLRPRHSTGLPAAPAGTPTSGHIPSFETLDSFQPRKSAIVHGTLLTLILFYMTVFGIRYSWIHVLNIHIPEVGANPTEPLSGDFKKSTTHVQVDVIPTESEAAQRKTLASTGPRTAAAPLPPRPVTIWLDQYVGKYISINPPAQIWIRIERDPFTGDHLSLSLADSGAPSVALSPVSAARFVLVGAENSYVDFTADVQGRICCLSFIANGGIITAQRQ